ncbi:MAG: hypothetical protein HQL38_20485, partial [Alphaproteobacteria bacterium]|nr:hypothetical protein [Alphaproteobacteria bacterium]
MTFRYGLAMRPAQIRLHALSLAALLVAPIAFQVPLGLAPLMAVTALVLAVCWGVERRMPPVPLPLAAVLGLFALLATGSALWALEPGQSAGRALRFLAESAAGLTLLASLYDAGDEGRRRVLGALAGGTGLTLALVAIDVGGDGVLTRALHGPQVWLTDTNRGASILALLVWPLGLWAWRRHCRAGLLLPL